MVYKLGFNFPKKLTFYKKKDLYEIWINSKLISINEGLKPQVPYSWYRRVKMIKKKKTIAQVTFSRQNEPKILKLK